MLVKRDVAVWAVVIAACVLDVAAATEMFSVRCDANAPVWERTAVRELEDYLGRLAKDGDVRLDGKSGVVFHVGDTAFARQHGIEAKTLKDEEWRIKSFGRDVVLVGGGTRGTIYAVAHFLEDWCDVHWWSEREEYVPQARELSLPVLDAGGSPVMPLRRNIYESVIGDGGPHTAANRQSATNVSRIAVLNRLNDTRVELPAYGGAARCGSPSFCHTFDRYVPWKEYKDTHPEWFSLVGGKRIGGIITGQLCVTNPELEEVFHRKLLAYIADDEAAAARIGVPPPRLYDISMNDSMWVCQCERCTAEAKKYNHSGVYLKYLINPLAKRLARSHPDLLLTTLAYHFTEMPPVGGVRAEDNVLVRLCDTSTSMAGSPSEPGNTSFRDNLIGWNRCARNLMVCDYSICYSFSRGLVNATSFPVASELHYPELFRLFRDTGVKGFMIEHENNHISDFHELKYFLQCKLAENPDADAAALTDLFMDRYYGKAGGILSGYRKDLGRICRERHGYVSWEPGLAAFNFISDADILRYQALFDDAERLVRDDPVRLLRVRHARSGLDALCVQRARTRVVYHGPKKPKPDAEESLRRLRRDLPAWFARNGYYGDAFDGPEKYMSITNDLPEGEPMALPPPPAFADRRYYDFYPWDLHCAQTARLVDDPSSPVGKAARIDTTVDPNDYWGLPFVVGFHNRTGIGLSGVKGLDKPAGKGYHWYKFQTGLMPPSEWIYLTRGWQISLRTGLSRLAGETLETWVSIKFEGSRYFPDDPSEKGKPSAISIDRMIFAEPNER